MSGVVASWRALTRLAWRDVRLRKGRTALVVAMIGLPVAALLYAASFVRTATPTEGEDGRETFGTADLRVWLNDNDPALPELPDGSRTMIIRSSYAATRIDNRSASVNVIAADLDDPMLVGMVSLTDGASPAAQDEAAISEALAEKTGWAIGDTVRAYPFASGVRVTGLVESPESLDTNLIVVPTTVQPYPPGGSTQVLVLLPPGSTFDSWWQSEVGALPTHAIQVRSWSNYYGRDLGVPELAALYVGATVLLTLLGLIAMAAFSAGARRHLRTLGLLAANGADPRQVRRALVLQGILTAAVAAAIGVTLAIVALLMTHGWWDELLHRRNGPLVVSPIDVTAVVMVAIATGGLAAALPARNMARNSVLAALAGRRPLQPIRDAAPVLGLIGVITGLGVVMVTIAMGFGGTWAGTAVGSVIALLGMALASPWLVARLEPGAARLGGARRLAARTLARHRSRTAPMVSAIAAMVACALGVVTLVASNDAALADVYDAVPRRTGPDVIELNAIGPDGATAPVTDDLLAPVRAIVPDAREFRFAHSDIGYAAPELVPVDPGAERLTADVRGSVIAPDAATAEQLAGAAAAASLADGRAVVPLALAALISGDGTIALGIGTPGEVPSVAGYLPAVVANEMLNIPGVTEGGVILVPDFVWNRLGAAPSYRATVIPDHPLTADQRDRLDQLREVDVDDDEPILEMYLSAPRDYTVPGRNDLRLLVLGGAGVLALAVMVIGLALTAAEQRDEIRLLVAVGARPTVRRRVIGWQAALLVGLATAVGVPLGLAAGVAMWEFADHETYEPNAAVSIPWLSGLIVLVGLPLVAGLGAAAFTRTRRVVDLRRL